MSFEQELEKQGWKSWENDPPKDSDIVVVVYMNSKIFPKGASLQASVEEVKGGVTGDCNPTYWKEID